MPDALQGDGHWDVKEKQGSHLAPLALSIQAASLFTVNQNHYVSPLPFVSLLPLGAAQVALGPGEGQEVSEGQSGER